MRAGELLEGRFLLQRIAGSGGMGSVFTAIDQENGKTVAVKIMLDQDRSNSARFDRERSLLAELSHPAIVRFIADGNTPAGERYLVMDWIDGISLGAKLTVDGLTAIEAVTVAGRAAEALGEAHRRGVVHRDLKPSNLMLPAGKVAGVMLIDFGIARRLREEMQLTRTGALVGSPGYLSPEQARGGRDIGPPCDVFSLGCVLFESLTGRAPFYAESLAGVLAKILLADAPPLRALCPEAPEALELLVRAMLAKDPAARPRDGAEVAARLAAMEPPGRGPRRPSRRQDPQTQVSSPSARSRVTPRSPNPATEEPLVCVVLAGVVEAVAPGSLPATVAAADAERQAQGLGESVAQFGAILDVLADGTIMAVLSSGGSTRDQVALAARCALALRAHLPEAPMALMTTAAGADRGRARLDEVIDRGVRAIGMGGLAAMFAAAMDSSRPPEAIDIDELTASLLEDAFEIGRQGTSVFLVAERRR